MARPLDTATRLFKALGHPARLRILAMLRTGELCVCQVTAVLGLAPSTVSAHLAELRRAELLHERKEGRWVHLSLSPEPHVVELLETVWRRLDGDPTVASDAGRVERLRCLSPEEVCTPGFTLGGATG